MGAERREGGRGTEEEGQYWNERGTEREEGGGGGRYGNTV